MLSRYNLFGIRLFIKLSLKMVMKDTDLRKNLLASRISYRPEEYKAFALTDTMLITIITTLIVILSNIIWRFSIITIFILLLSVVAMGVITYIAYMLLPQLIATSRAKNIDSHLLSSANFISTMSAGGANPVDIIEKLAHQEMYGELQREFKTIWMDITFFKDSILTALRKAIDRSPSVKFNDFLQGIIATITSGGDLKKYFQTKSQIYMNDIKIQRKTVVDTLGTLAESFIVLVVAGPLFFIIILSLFSIMSPPFMSLFIILMYIIVLIFLPLVHAIFLLTADTMTREG